MFSPASPALSQINTDSQARRLSSGSPCVICKGVLKSGQATLCCIYCSESIHLACQLKQFQDAGNEALKNIIEGLCDVIKFAALAR